MTEGLLLSKLEQAIDHSECFVSGSAVLGQWKSCQSCEDSIVDDYEVSAYLSEPHNSANRIAAPPGSLEPVPCAGFEEAGRAPHNRASADDDALLHT